jgi:hypothetical protein
MTAGAMIYSSCARDELFEREQYKKVFSLLSADGFNIFSEVHELDSVISPGNVSAVCGGTLPTEEDIHISLVEDESLIDEYNRSNFDVDASRYINWLPADRYKIEDYSITIPAGERTGLMSVKVQPNGLSPDSTYFVPLRVTGFSSYEIDHKKATVLYHVYLKNYYATSNALRNSHTSYSARIRTDTNVMISKTKQLFPLSGNSVRTTAGELSYAANVTTINTNSIVLTVNREVEKIGVGTEDQIYVYDASRVTVTPWKDDNLELQQIDGDPDYPNIFFIYDDGYGKTYKTFLLRYNYRYKGTDYTIQEELRLEFKEELEY